MQWVAGAEPAVPGCMVVQPCLVHLIYIVSPVDVRPCGCARTRFGELAIAASDLPDRTSAWNRLMPTHPSLYQVNDAFLERELGTELFRL